MSDTLSRQFRKSVAGFNELNTLGRKDTSEVQQTIARLITDFEKISIFLDRLDLYDDDERLEEINPSYLPYLGIDYYLGSLYLQFMLPSNTIKIGTANPAGTTSIGSDASVANKEPNLQIAKSKLINFLLQLKYKTLLTKDQISLLDSFKDTLNPTYEELIQSTLPPASKRALKIQNYRLEKELSTKISILDNYYNKEEESFEKFDEETIRQIFVDQLKYFVLNTFSQLEQIAMELQVLSQRLEFEKRMSNREMHNSSQVPEEKKFGPDGYTTRLETVPQIGKASIGQLVDKLGKILQPFTISSRQDIQKKVQGTGQVLPSMTVDEYLDYELANGKMMKEEVKDTKAGEEHDTDDSDEEVEKRKWDDWKDDNPKGSGNTMKNVG